jgi:prolipoprotein diacylglyceryl transferase
MTAAIPSPSSNVLHLGPFDLHVYGLMYVLAVAASVAITARRWQRAGGDRALVWQVALWAFPAGLVGGRLYFLATSWNEVPPHWWGPFAIWQGGLGIWGGIAAGTLVGLLVLRRRGADIPRFLDAAAPALLVAQSIGRVGNWFNQELFGGPTSLPWGLKISAAHRPPGYAQDATFHPTFLYEIVWNLGLAAGLVWLGHHRRIRPPGLFALYVAGYSLGRIGEELLRVDPAHHILGLRLNFFVASLLCVGGLLWFARTQGRLTRWPRRGAALVAIGASAAALAGCGHAGQTGPPARIVAVRMADESCGCATSAGSSLRSNTGPDPASRTPRSPAGQTSPPWTRPPAEAETDRAIQAAKEQRAKAVPRRHRSMRSTS